MSADPKRVESIFAAALALPVQEQRVAFLDDACLNDPALRARVDALLQAHTAAGSFLQAPVPGLAATVDEHPLGEQPGMSIGPYKLLQQIGEGGMGVVYMAEQQEPVRRLVALKIIKPGMDSAQVLARFDAERQALALMDHPNIAKVHDAGATEDGRPFFVMELVKGTPITAFCDANQLSARQRLELFVPVCQAIQHAHQKGVIHRDIKPSNVLIALYDDRPVPKVIDFGIAKAAGSPLTELTLHTGFGAIVGTPEYMSPEQATFNQLDIDTRSDVYSLGVLLYELLTGSTPVDKTRLKEAALLEVLRLVREEEPPCPSVKLSTTAARARIAGTRGTDANKLAQLLRGELDWIVMKALEKDRNRRYETAAGLARDVDRYLKDELVEARPPSAGYRVRKFVNRNRGKVVAASLLFLALLAGVIGTTLGMMRARDAEARAEDDKKVAEVRRNQAILAEAEADEQKRKAQAQACRADTARHALVMEQAMRAFENQDVGEATRYLDQVAPPFQQSWETRYLRDLCRRKFRPFPLLADESLGWVYPSNDGRWLVGLTSFTNQPSTLHVVDARTGKTRFKFFMSVKGWSFSHDGKWLAAAGTVNTQGKQSEQTKVFDLETGRERLAFPDMPGGVLDVEVSPDDTRIALICRGKVLVCDAGSGKVLQTLDRVGEINRVQFSPNGKRFAAWYSELPSQGRHLKVWDLETGKEKISRKTGAMSVALSADGKFLALSTQTTVELWDAETGETRWTFDKITSQNIGIAFSPDSKHIACTGTDMVYVLDTSTGKVQNSFTANSPHGLGRGNPLFASGVAYLPDGEHLVTGNGVWNLNHVGSEKFVCKDRSPDSKGALEHGSMGIVNYSADGKRLLACFGTSGLPKSGVVEELPSWDATTGHQSLPVVRIKGYGHMIDSRAFSRNGQRIVFGRRNGFLPVCDTITGKELISISVPKSGYQFVAMSPDGTWVASSDGKRIIIWDAATGAKKQTCSEHPLGTGNIAISADGKRIAATENPWTNKERLVLIWDVKTGRQLLSCPSNEAIATCLAFSPDGERLVVGHEGAGTLTMWDTRTGGILYTLKGHTTTVTSVAFSPDGKRLATGSFDQTVRLWDVETGQEVLAIKQPSSRIASLAFSPDGKCLAAITGYKVVTVWEAP